MSTNFLICEYYTMAKSFLEDVVTKIEDLNVSLTAIENFTETLDDTKNDLISQSINDFLSETVKKFTFSVLKGEYISKKELNVHIKDIKKAAEAFDEEAFNEFPLRQTYTKELSPTITSLSDSYLHFINRISNYFSREERILAFEKRNTIYQNDDSTLTKETKALLQYFNCVLELSNIDHFPSNTNKFILELYDLENTISSLNIRIFDDITSNIKEKISFLKHKWKIRKKHENPNSIFYALNGDIKSVDDYDGENEELKEWCSIIQTQYELDAKKWPSQLEQRVSSYKKKKLADLTNIEIHQLIKYYKDSKKSISKLNTLCQEIHDRSSSQVNPNFYDEYVNEIFYNYSLNNKFSLYLETAVDIESVNNYYKETKESIEGKVSNFFLLFKYLEFLGDFFIKKINSTEKLNYLTEYKKLIENLTTNELNEYREYKEWSKVHHNYVFMLPYGECKPNCVKG